MKKYIINVLQKLFKISSREARVIDNLLHVQLLKASAGKPQIVDDTKPQSWEFSGFSQNGEDGIVEFLVRKLNNCNKYFVEIGSSNGLVNNTSYLAIVQRWTGLMVEGEKTDSDFCRNLLKEFCGGVECLNLFVKTDNISSVVKLMLYKNPDVLSLDIDGNDYYIAKELFNLGVRPKIFIVEYNSAFGPTNSVTIEYEKNFNLRKSHPSFLYYGVSISAWLSFFTKNNYELVTVDSNGVNAVFIDKNEFDNNFYESLKGLKFKENFWQLMKFKMTWEKQFEKIKDCAFIKVGK
ncbi:MAG TPA: hypothetical protein VKC90_12335 [Chitinophagaceae bacterium]|nr:hypothetical protein [Chitinophagaceae bacterium]